MRSTRR